METDSAGTAGTLSREQLCTITGLTDRRHRQLADKGYFPPPVQGRYQAGKTLVGVIRYLGEQLRKKNSKLAQEQIGLTKAKRQLAEEDLAEVRGKYVAKAE